MCADASCSNLFFFFFSHKYTLDNVVPALVALMVFSLQGAVASPHPGAPGFASEAACILKVVGDKVKALFTPALSPNHEKPPTAPDPCASRKF